MRGLSILAVIAVIAGGASPVVAQQKTAPARPKEGTGETCTSTNGKVECRKILEGGYAVRLDSAMMKRAVLGLELSATGTARDTLGVFISSVTPKGPAENAGIIEGERIASINGVDLRVAPGDVEDGYASGLPSHRLQREVAKLTPGSRVNLRVYSGGRVRDVQVTAGRASDFMRTRTFFGDGEGGPGAFIFRDGMEMPPMPLMQMREMEPLAHMKMMEMMPQMRKLEASPEMQKLRESLPQLRQKMEMSPEFQKLRQSMPQMRMQIMPSMVMPFRRTIRI
ncbi:MAG: PDZ domain-containing protein [Gemmatimonadaceae bacterium]